MNQTLRMLSDVIHPDRLYILETDGKTVSNTFEWCAPGIQPEIGTLQNLNYQEYIGGWECYLETDTSVVIENIEELKEQDPIDYYNLKRQGINRIIEAPFYCDGTLIGYLGADNYEQNDLLNTKELLEMTSFFLSAKVTNHNLLRELDRMSHYDMLTGIHNRNALIEKKQRLEQMHVPLGILYADLNGLKKINDKKGHAAGDRVLQSFASILQECYGEENVYREGGDEFVVLLPFISKAEFENSQKRFLDRISRREEIKVAVGSHWIEDSAKIEKASFLVDERMYQSKEEYYQRQGRY